MSNVEDRMKEIEAAKALDDRYEAAKAEYLRKQRVQQGEAGALMFAALAYGDVLENYSLFAKASHAAKLVCIAAVFIIPNLLFIRVVF
jgi:hypothetical protein